MVDEKFEFRVNPFVSNYFMREMHFQNRNSWSTSDEFARSPQPLSTTRSFGYGYAPGLARTIFSAP